MRNKLLYFLILFNLPAFAYDVVLTWNYSPSTNAIGYNVYFWEYNQSKTYKIDVGDTNQATIQGLTTTSTFAVTAYDSNRNESLFSNEVTYNTNSVTPYVVYLGAILNYGTNIANMSQQSQMILAITNPPPGQVYSVELVITNNPF